MSPEARLPVESGDVVGGKYRIDRIIGIGGMGVVVAATHIELEQPVALKFLLPDRDPGLGPIARFFREARAVARLKSEHVARVFDVGEHYGHAYMVMELLDGEDLGELQAKRGRLPVGVAVDTIIQACDGLVDAHVSGIVHRDLKPQNIFVTRRYDGKPLVKLVDFGIAKTFGAATAGDPDLTNATAVMGSPLYMPPEQVRSSRTADTRSDIWALGVILYEALSGCRPFSGSTVMEVFFRVLNEAPQPLEEASPGLDPQLAAIVMRCLEKDPAQRFQSASLLATALKPFRSISADATAELPPIHPNKLEQTGTSWTDERTAIVRPPSSHRVRKVVLALTFALAAAVAIELGIKTRQRAEPAFAAPPPPALSVLPPPIPTMAVSALPNATDPIR